MAKTFDVYYLDDGRWELDSTDCSIEAAATAAAANLETGYLDAAIVPTGAWTRGDHDYQETVALIRKHRLAQHDIDAMLGGVW